MVKTIRGLIPRFSGTALTLTFGVFLAVSLSSSQPLAAQQFDSCKGGTLDSGTKDNPQDLVVTNMTCTVDGTKGPYYFRNVYIFGSGATGTLTFSDATMDFYAANILVQNNGVLQAAGIGAGNNGNVLTIHLYGGSTGPGVTCQKMDNGNLTQDNTCGVPTVIWTSNLGLVMKDMQHRYPKTCLTVSQIIPNGILRLPGGVDDCFYQYDVFDPNDSEGAYFGKKVLALSYGGTINLSGYKGAQGGDDGNPMVTGSSWMRLNSTLKGGENSLKVSGTPSDWRPNDNIVLTSTDYLPGHAEQVQIASVSGSTVDLMGTVKNPHWGQPYSLASVPCGASGQETTCEIGPDLLPGQKAVDRNIDTRAAVGLLSRSIRIISDGATPGSQLTGYYGGHTVVRQAFLSYQIQGVEFYQMGQGGAIGHYPVHFHMARQTPPNTYVKDSSMWDSMTRWITIHATQNVTLARNVGYKSIGHGFYLEDGSEANNVLNTNLGVFARAAVDNEQNDRKVPGILAETGDPSPPEQDPYHSDWRTPTVFWIMNGWNEFQYNFASSAGTCGVCYWLLPGGISVLSQFEYFYGYAGQQLVEPNPLGPGLFSQAGYTPLGTFVGNSCSTAMMAFLNVGKASDCDGVSNDGDTSKLQAVPNPVAPARGQDGMDNYYPYVGSLRNPTGCTGPNCRCAPGEPTCNPPCTGSNNQEGTCVVTTLDRFSTSFNWAEKNFSAIWLRPWWFLVKNSAITDPQQGGITFVTSGGYTRADVAQGYWSLLRNSALVGNTQDPDGNPGNPYASSAGPFNPHGLQCSPGPPTAAYCLSQEQGISYPSDSFNSNQRLINIYDGPSYQQRNAFLDIPVTKIGMRSTASCPPPTQEKNYQFCDFGYLAAVQPGIPVDPGSPAGSPECYIPNAAIAWKQSNGFFYPPAFHSDNLFFNNVDIRHFVIEPLFNYNSFQTNQTEVAQQYCTFPGGYNGTGLLLFNNFTDIDRQTVLNDDDGSLTGLLADPGNGMLRETISVNKDPFFNAPVTTPECASDIHDGGPPDIGPPNTADTSPYEYVTTATIANCGIGPSGCPQAGGWNAWGGDCGNSSCYGVPLYRQYLTTKDNPKQPPVIRMMGQGTGQRSTLTVNHGKYYIDDQVSRLLQELVVGATGNLNVYLPNQTYYTYFIYAKPDMDQTYQMFVGYGLDPKTVEASVKQYRMIANNQAFIFNGADSDKPFIVNKTYDPSPKGSSPTAGLVTVEVSLSAYQSEFDDAKSNFCQPTTYCQAQGSGSQTQCVCNPKNKDCTDSSVCSWAIKDIDCPLKGCFSWGITLPSTFATGVAKPPTPTPFPNDLTKLVLPPDEYSGGGTQCQYTAPPSH